MKKLLVICFVLCSYISSLLAQEVIVPVWSKIEDSPIGEAAEGWGLDVDSEGNVYWPISVNTNNQGLDIICYKFDANGTALWSNPLFFGGPSTQHSYSCNAESDFLYVGGRFCESNGFDCDMQLLKVNKSDGSLVWANEYDFGNNGYDEVDGIEVRDNAIFLSGWAQALESGPFRSDIGLLKLDLDGNEIWSNFTGELDTAEHLDGHFVVDDNFIFGCGLWNGDNGFNIYNGHSFLGKFSKVDGTLIDSVLFGSQSNTFLDIDNALGMATDGTYLYITGYTILPGGNNWQLYIAKYDKDLNEIWYDDWGGSGTESARGITVENGVVYVAGLTQSTELATQGGADALLLEYDVDGELLSYRIWGDTQDNTFRDIVVQGDDIYLSGSSGEDLLTFGGTSDEAFIIKTTTNQSLSVAENDINSLSIEVLPNPVKDVLQVKTEIPISKIILYDITGSVVANKTISFIDEPTLNMKALPSALYFAKFISDDGIFVRRVVKQ